LGVPSSSVKVEGGERIAITTGRFVAPGFWDSDAGAQDERMAVSRTRIKNRFFISAFSSKKSTEMDVDIRTFGEKERFAGLPPLHGQSSQAYFKFNNKYRMEQTILT
jgi:hypothetical protein